MSALRTIGDVLEGALSMPGGRVSVLERPELLRGTRYLTVVVPDPMRPHQVTLITWSKRLLPMLLHPFALWHDDHEADHCRTWADAGGCRCEVEPL